MTTYRVPFENGESAFTEKRSRFISHIWRVETEAEARERIEEMKKRYYDARHNCWCYLLQEGGVVRYSDDGEEPGQSVPAAAAAAAQAPPDQPGPVYPVRAGGLGHPGWRGLAAGQRPVCFQPGHPLHHQDHH